MFPKKPKKPNDDEGGEREKNFWSRIRDQVESKCEWAVQPDLKKLCRRMTYPVIIASEILKSKPYKVVKTILKHLDGEEEKPKKPPRKKRDGGDTSKLPKNFPRKRRPK